jgi:hypothetical protein
MAQRDLVKDLNKAAKLFKRLGSGELTLTELLLGGKTVIANEGDEKCDKTQGCVGILGHEAGCILDVPETSPMSDESVIETTGEPT